MRDASGNLLANGDSIVLIKDLKVKGADQTLKQGTVIRSIRLTDNPEKSTAGMRPSRGSSCAPNSCASARQSVSSTVTDLRQGTAWSKRRFR